MIDRCGISRDAAVRDGLQRLNDLEQRFQTEVRVPVPAKDPTPNWKKRCG